MEGLLLPSGVEGLPLFVTVNFFQQYVGREQGSLKSGLSQGPSWLLMAATGTGRTVSRKINVPMARLLDALPRLIPKSAGGVLQLTVPGKFGKS